MKNIEILIRIALNLYIALDNMYILTLLILSVYEHGVFPFVLKPWFVIIVHARNTLVTQSICISKQVFPSEIMKIQIINSTTQKYLYKNTTIP